MEYVVLFAIAVAIGVGIGKTLADDAKLKEAERKRLETERHQKEREIELHAYQEQREKAFRVLLHEARQFRDELTNGMLRGRQWLANAFSEFVNTRSQAVECWLAVKPHPAAKAAEHVAELRQINREAARRLKLLEYQIASYEEYFPALIEFREAILDEAVDLRQAPLEALGAADPALARGYLSKEEYDSLSTAEKFQLSLDRYWNRRKSDWEIGRVYERFIGYLYEKDGWRVTYHGIMKGFEDFGRDLICRKDSDVHIVQCKCWSREKVIREKHVFQLFGTSVLYRLASSPDQTHLFDVRPKVTPVFVATAPLSTDAAAVAEYLEVSVRSEALCRYPMIKCNVNAVTQDRIYHLPFDQQYDTTIIGNVPGEFYANTVAEAEAAGFRRAFRWQGVDGQGSE